MNPFFIWIIWFAGILITSITIGTRTITEYGFGFLGTSLMLTAFGVGLFQYLERNR